MRFYYSDFQGHFAAVKYVRVDDLTETPDGLKVNIRTSKTDQDGQGHIIAIPHGQKFPVTMALKKWLQMAQIHQGFVFRRVHKGGKTVGDALQPLAVSQILKSYITRIGYNADEYGAHSLRSGFLTEAAEHGASLFKILEISRHKSTDMILHYIKSAELFKDHAGKDFL
jgi:integrase